MLRHMLCMRQAMKPSCAYWAAQPGARGAHQDEEHVADQHQLLHRGDVRTGGRHAGDDELDGGQREEQPGDGAEARLARGVGGGGGRGAPEGDEPVCPGGDIACKDAASREAKVFIRLGGQAPMHSCARLQACAQSSQAQAPRETKQRLLTSMSRRGRKKTRNASQVVAVIGNMAVMMWGTQKRDTRMTTFNPDTCVAKCEACGRWSVRAVGWLGRAGLA